MTILLTGSAGFIGSHLAERLLSLGHTVIGLDNFDEQYSVAQKYANLQSCLSHSGYTFVQGDIRDQKLVADLLRQFDCDTVIHLAARTGVRPSVDEPGIYLDVNVNGTLAILEAMRTTNVKRIILASSSSVYGNSPHLPFREDDLAAQPLSPYAMSKRSAELLAYTYHHLHGFSVSNLRFFTVYGPRQRPEMAISQFTDKIFHGSSITLYGDGSTARNYTYISDIVQGIVQTLRHLKGYSIFNIGGPGSVSLLTLVHKLEVTLAQKAVINWQPEQAGDVVRTEANTELAARCINFHPLVDLPEGLRRFVDWYLLMKQSPNHAPVFADVLSSSTIDLPVNTFRLSRFS